MKGRVSLFFVIVTARDDFFRGSLSSCCRGLAEFVQEIGCQLILSRLELLLCAARIVKDGDIETVLLAPQEMGVKEVHNL